MALKMDRQVNATDITFYLDDVRDRGVFVVYSTVGSGVALDSTRNLAAVSANSSGQRPIGCLLSDTVNIDRTRQPLNWHKDQQASGDKVCILTNGWIVTDQITGTPTVGQLAVLSSSGTVTGVTNGATTWNQAANPFVGYFVSTKDENGFARVKVAL